MKKSGLLLSAITLAVVTFSSCKKDEMAPAPTTDPGASAARMSMGGGIAGAVYVQDNSAGGNHVMIFSRKASGELVAAGSVATGGSGTGSGLGSQGAIINDDRFVYAVNAGSHDISVLLIDGNSLTWTDRVPSGGSTPISLTVHGAWLYVLNAGGTGNISGFSVSSDGHLSHLQGSDQALSTSASGGAEVLFSEDGTHLVVTEKATNMITVYPVDAAGIAGHGASYPSSGATPFGFALGKNNTLIVSDAFGGASLASALSSYSLGTSGSIHTITGPVNTNQTAACWVAVANNGRFSYTTNAGSASISMYTVSNSGELTLVQSFATGANPIDVALSGNSRYLYNLNNGDHSLSMFSVNTDGSLSSLGALSGIPAGSVGLAAN